MLTALKIGGFPSVPLSVQKEIFAVKMYKRAGFEVVKDNGGGTYNDKEDTHKKE